MTDAATVADAMLRHPTVHSAGMTVAEARAVFAASPKIRLLLLAEDGVLVSTLAREDLSEDAAPEDRAAAHGTLAGRTAAPETPLASTHEAMVDGGWRRLAVVAPDGRLLGLLCLKRSLTGFCTDEGVAAMRQGRDRRH